jgi:hypothetical protein
MSLSNRGELEEMAVKTQQIEQAWMERLEKQTHDFERQLAEKDKWFEALKARENTELHKIISDKEKEVFTL